jgi:hypothetical protein
MQTVESIAAKLVKSPAINHYNYWSPLACQVNKQENIEIPTPKKERLSSILTDTSSRNKIAAHWARKIENQKLQTGILDTGATSGAGSGTGQPEDADAFEYTGNHQQRCSCSQTRADYLPPT